MLNKKGISAVITTVIMIGLVVVSISIVWTVVNNLVSEKISSSESCFGNFEKVTIGKRYTCYDPENNKFRFSINIEDIEVESVLVSVSGNAGTKSFEIKKEDNIVTDLAYYGVVPDNPIKLPDKNEGKAYVLLWSDTSNPPNMIQIAPTVNGNRCETSDSLALIDDCSALA